MEEGFEEELLPLLGEVLLPLPVLSTITTAPPLEAVAVPALVSDFVPDVDALAFWFSSVKNGNNIPFFLWLQLIIKTFETINNIRIFFIIPISLL
ncbi:hypothetical protein LEP1GSC121_1444 [Leptospira borgpetersenii serovar Castellonis str. 200801910]|nr:hypothetical protein D1609_18235 [Leptospira borgpetersenii serovar Hardjo-bovis]EKR01195.1 hypothetical protein LEP1GSC121_1444 [Leptospira borgpetersenii serovar Castellonis str. 200801910]EMN15275.1 hypothetical protein LEP1GSC055_2810 [Leptospira borgpetersenii str. Brem 307]TQE53913.1 hypothetical protein FFZ95_05925 [Leptospira borgpetersenii]